tara:strand:- start:222 stop:737 length:516 start_codon:yes stop_codon:yes gene_type:complete
MALTKVIGSGIGTVTNQFADANMAVGSVLQVVTGTTTTSTSQTSTTWADTTLTANITPSSSSSKIFILVNQSYRIQRSTYFGGGSIKILRGSTFLYYAAENTVPYYPYLETTQGTGGVNKYDYQTLNFLDSPSSTSELTYKTQQRSYSSSDLINTQQGGAASTIILMEIAG